MAGEGGHEHGCGRLAGAVRGSHGAGESPIASARVAPTPGCPRPPMVQVASRGDAGEVGRLLDAGAAVDAADMDPAGRITLLEAASQGHEAVVDRLLVAGAAVDAADYEERTALHRAADQGHEAVVGRLLVAGAAVDAATHPKLTALHLAANHGDEAVVDRLLTGADAGPGPAPRAAAEARPPRRLHRCAACGTEGTKLGKCGRCKAVRYCGRECQLGHWREHKPGCAR